MNYYDEVINIMADGKERTASDVVSEMTTERTAKYETQRKTVRNCLYSGVKFGQIEITGRRRNYNTLAIVFKAVAE